MMTIPPAVQALAGSVVVRPIPGHVFYFATEDGRIISNHIFYRDTQGPRFLRQHRSRSGYMVVPLTRRYRAEYVHVLVASAFHGPKPAPGYEVAHLDHNPHNNAASNLQWVTHAENVRATHQAGRKRKAPASTGRRLTPEEVKVIKQRLAAGEKIYVIAQDYGVDRCTVSSIKRGRSWRHVEP